MIMSLSEKKTMSGPISSLPRVYRVLPTHEARANETASAQASRIRSIVLKNWMTGRIFISMLYKENQVALEDLGYIVELNSHAEYPPMWSITWSAMTRRQFQLDDVLQFQISNSANEVTL